MNEILPDDHISNPTTLDKILPEVKSKVLYHNPDHITWNKTYILGRLGKAGGRNSALFNRKDLTQDKHISVDFSKIHGWKNIE